MFLAYAVPYLSLIVLPTSRLDIEANVTIDNSYASYHAFIIVVEYDSLILAFCTHALRFINKQITSLKAR